MHSPSSLVSSSLSAARANHFLKFLADNAPVGLPSDHTKNEKSADSIDDQEVCFPELVKAKNLQDIPALSHFRLVAKQKDYPTIFSSAKTESCS